ncbi:M23 family metallopeptidase [bacterium]|nr:M23 family metallopeptidase [bacterium]
MKLLNGYGGGCAWPGCGYHRYCRFYAVDLVHGTNRPATQGTWVLAAGRGWVDSVGKDGTRGNYIVLHHGNGLYTEYVHLNCDLRPYFRVGDDLAGGTYIGKIGKTGAAGGVPHLHFVVMVSDNGCGGSYAGKRSIPINGIDGDWDLRVGGVYYSNNRTKAGPRGFDPGDC